MGRIGGFGIILAVLCFLPLFGSATGQDSVQIFTNGSIYIDAEKKVDNLLVIDGVVKELNVSADKYKNATAIDLKGAAVYPGFIDSHVHLMETGYFFYVGANLIGCNDSASIARVLADKVKSIPEGGVVLGAGFSLRDYDNWSLEDLARPDLFYEMEEEPAGRPGLAGRTFRATMACRRYTRMMPADSR